MNPAISSILDFQPRTRIVFGAGAIEQLGQLVCQYGGTRALLVTDPGIVAAGHAQRAEKSLAAAGVHFARFDRVVENPTTEVVDACVAAARQEQVDFLVGLGGGSSMDTAKGCNFLITNGGRMEDYWGVGKATRPMLPLIAIPTTAGTGSECQSFALITHPQTHLKMACGDPKAAARVAILDPELTLTQPPAVAAATGMDALSHAIETAVTRRRNPISQMLSREAFRLCARGLRRVFGHPQDFDARSQSGESDVLARADVLLGAALAGMAIENSMLGAAHAAANPLTARFGVIHGHAVGVMLPAVVRFNARDPEVAPLYHQLALQGGLIDSQSANGTPAGEKIARFIRSYQQTAGLPRSLAGIEISNGDIELLAADAAKQWTGTFNPRPVSEQDFAELYREVLVDNEGVKSK
ncbi:MAG: iron-containing alcohol dehydrogenase [Thermoguttaceae bacterium]